MTKRDEERRRRLTRIIQNDGITITITTIRDNGTFAEDGFEQN